METRTKILVLGLLTAVVAIIALVSLWNGRFINEVNISWEDSGSDLTPLQIQNNAKQQDVGDDILEKSSSVDSWKEYRNEDYGFSLKYPTDWLMLDHSKSTYGTQAIFLNDGKISEGCCSGLRIEFRAETMALVRTALRSDFGSSDLLSYQEALVAGIPSSEMIFLTHYGNSNEKIVIVALRPNETILFRHGQDDPVAEKILETLVPTEH